MARPRRGGVAWAQRAARALFELPGVEKSAPVDVEGIAKRLGAVIQVSSFPVEDGVSGFFARTPDGPIIAVNRAHSVTRQRFTIAHEIGHMRLHEFEGVHLDSTRRLHRDGRSSQGLDPIEVEANAFAAELLMPEDLIRAECGGGGYSLFLDEDSAEEGIARLARRFKVSTQAMQWRLTNLGLLV